MVILGMVQKNYEQNRDPKMISKILLLVGCVLLVEGASVTKRGLNLETPGLPLHYFGEKSYYFQSYIKATHQEGFLFCSNLNMGLVSIESKQENDFLFDTIGSLIDYETSNFWTSGMRSGTIWYWNSSGKPFSFSHWSSNQPTDDGNCLQVTHDSSEITMSWSNANCTETNYVICEGEGLPTSTTTATSPSIFLPV